MIRFCKALLLSLGVYCAAVAQAASLSGATLEWAPFAGAQSLNGGIAVDIVRAAFKRAGYTLEVRFLPWERALSETQNRQLDVLVGAWYSTERARIYHMSEPFLHNRIVFIKRQGDDFEFDGLDSLRGKKVGVIRNYTYSAAFSAATHFKKPATSNLVSNLKKLAAQRIDLTLEDEIVARHTLNTQLPALRERLAFSRRALSEEGLHIAISRDHPQGAELVRAFNEGLAKLKADGSYRDILRRHGL